jgi:hypothetical protein
LFTASKLQALYQMIGGQPHLLARINLRDDFVSQPIWFGVASG